MFSNPSAPQAPRFVRYVVAVLSFGFLAWVPLFLASNRPILWAINGGLLSAIALFAVLFDRRAVNQALATRALLVLFFGLLAWLLTTIVLGLLFPYDIEVGRALLDQLVEASTFASLVPSDSFFVLITIIGFGLLWWICRFVFKDMPPQFALALIVAIIGIHATLGLLEFLIDWKFPVIEHFRDGYDSAATGGFVNRNSFATYLGLGAVGSLGLILSGVHRASRVGDRAGVVPSILLGVIVLVLVLTVQTLTQSRAGLFSTAISLFLVIVLFGVGYRTFWTSLLFVLIFVLGVAVASYVSIEVLERFQKSSVSIEIRMEIYRQAMALWLERPWSGFGAGSFETIFGAIKDPRLPSEKLWTKAHNTYVAVLVELGLIGGSFMFGLFIVLGLQMIRTFFWNKSIVGLVGLGCLVLVGFHSLLDFSLEIYAVTATLLAILAAGYDGVPEDRKPRSYLADQKVQVVRKNLKVAPASREPTQPKTTVRRYTPQTSRDAGKAEQ